MKKVLVNEHEKIGTIYLPSPFISETHLFLHGLHLSPKQHYLTLNYLLLIIYAGLLRVRAYARIKRKKIELVNRKAGSRVFLCYKQMVLETYDIPPRPMKPSFQYI